MGPIIVFASILLPLYITGMVLTFYELDFLLYILIGVQLALSVVFVHFFWMGCMAVLFLVYISQTIKKTDFYWPKLNVLNTLEVWMVVLIMCGIVNVLTLVITMPAIG